MKMEISALEQVVKLEHIVNEAKNFTLPERAIDSLNLDTPNETFSQNVEFISRIATKEY